MNMNMNKNVNKLSIVITSFLILLISSCYVPKVVTNNGDRWIPKNFNPKKDILVVESSPSKTQTKKMEKYMDEKYPFKFEFATTEELKNKTGKFSNKEIYKFFLLNSSGTLTYSSDMNERNGGRHNVYAATNDFYFEDREAKKIYPESAMAASYPYQAFKNVINVILKKFE